MKTKEHLLNLTDSVIVGSTIVPPGIYGKYSLTTTREGTRIETPKTLVRLHRGSRVITFDPSQTPIWINYYPQISPQNEKPLPVPVPVCSDILDPEKWAHLAENEFLFWPDKEEPYVLYPIVN